MKPAPADAYQAVEQQWERVLEALRPAVEQGQWALVSTLEGEADALARRLDNLRRDTWHSQQSR